MKYYCNNYWQLTQVIREEDQLPDQSTEINKPGVGFTFAAFSNKIQPSFLTQYTLATFYTVIVIAFGNTLKSIVSYSGVRLTVTDQPYPDALLSICEAIAFYRLEMNLKM